MRVVIQRVLAASVTVEDEPVAAIGRGFLALLGVTHNDTAAVAGKLGDKVAGLRVFEDEAGRMNLGLAEIGGSILCVSQFTLYGDVRRGRRPSFDDAAPGDAARPLYECFCRAIEAAGIPCSRGAFGEHMQVSLVNDGPVTLILDSEDLEGPRR